MAEVELFKDIREVAVSPDEYVGVRFGIDRGVTGTMKERLAVEVEISVRRADGLTIDYPVERVHVSDKNISTLMPGDSATLRAILRRIIGWKHAKENLTE